MSDLRRCLQCGKVLSDSVFSTESMRTDGYCTAKCKRKTRWRVMKSARDTKISWKDNNGTR